jgi:hypothetical protein
MTVSKNAQRSLLRGAAGIRGGDVDDLVELLQCHDRGARIAELKQDGARLVAAESIGVSGCREVSGERVRRNTGRKSVKLESSGTVRAGDVQIKWRSTRL